MVLKVLPAEDTDMYRSAVIEHEAYKPLETNQILFPGPFPPDVLEHRANELKAQSNEPNTLCYKVIDTELEGEQMIAFSKWCAARTLGGVKTDLRTDVLDQGRL